MRIGTNIPKFILEGRDPRRFSESAFNYGDMVLRRSLLGLLRHHELVSVREPGDQPLDAVVMAMANCVAPHTATVAASFASMIESHSCPKYLLSIGAQNRDYSPLVLEEKDRKRLRRLLDQMDRIFVRGAYSKEVLLSNGLDYEFEIGACPSALVLPEELPDFTLSASSPRFVYHLPLPRQVPEDGLSSIGALVSSGDFRLVLQMKIDGKEELGGLPFHYPRSFDDWTGWIRSSDFVLGTRIHGTILGLALGVPSLCLTVDSRTQELCEAMGLPFIPFREFSARSVEEVVCTVNSLEIDREGYRKSMERIRGRFATLPWVDTHPTLQ